MAKYNYDYLSEFSLQLCDSCGACSCVCPMRIIYPDFNRKSAPRTLIRQTKLKTKYRGILTNALWLCFTCDACGDICPQGVKFREFVISEKERMLNSGKNGKLAYCAECRKPYIPRPVLKALKEKISSPAYQKLIESCPSCRQRNTGIRFPRQNV
ncbi:MAG: 4Fe-4S dicluster domain-containing protein [Planctomycetota bacterium]